MEAIVVIVSSFIRQNVSEGMRHADASRCRRWWLAGSLLLVFLRPVTNMQNIYKACIYATEISIVKRISVNPSYKRLYSRENKVHIENITSYATGDISSLLNTLNTYLFWSGQQHKIEYVHITPAIVDNATFVTPVMKCKYKITLAKLTLNSCGQESDDAQAHTISESRVEQLSSDNRLAGEIYH